MEKPETEQTDNNQIDGDNDVEQTRNDQDENPGNKRYDWLQMRNTDGHDVNPNWLASGMKRKAGKRVPCRPSRRRESTASGCGRLAFDL